MSVLPRTSNPAVQQLQMQLSAVTQRVHRLEAREHAQRCALQCLLAHWGQAKTTLVEALKADMAEWDANYENWPSPKPAQQDWREEMDDLIGSLAK